MLTILPEDIIYAIMTNYCCLDDVTVLLNTSKEFGQYRIEALDKEMHRHMDLIYDVYTSNKVVELSIDATGMVSKLSSVFSNINFFINYTPSIRIPKQNNDNIEYNTIISIFKDIVESHKFEISFKRMSKNESIVSSVAMYLYH